MDVASVERPVKDSARGCDVDNFFSPSYQNKLRKLSPMLVGGN